MEGRHWKDLEGRSQVALSGNFQTNLKCEAYELYAVTDPRLCLVAVKPATETASENYGKGRGQNDSIVRVSEEDLVPVPH
jgi:hypothetical protein